ncbi:cytochrome C oxidase subunit IV family protein [Chitinophaga nivalis]|uniref:Cytochrome C oxidase subunit IV family protein n=1 Tax=Chitinophaga nivalis TaxID=2991709 RepID=A0ABT3IUU4_9BACT|nr:cytochrome C oxidase subunit IV family protein [Chitinophaga nivalis]MCW3462653.1 cytochrome C oxidase subunit IV family protein [Chitinophaga nivalis]MCW3487656.1 cytochrome C oxidase subunit IV family protein [Chitinophaga nivalis]
MEHTHTAAGHENAHADSSTKGIWKTFWILLGITVVEVGLAFLHLETGFPSRLVLNGIFIILTIFKAFFIVAEFMHLGHEIKNLIMTILMPLLLFVWFIIAFLYEGDSWKNMRNDLRPGTPIETPKATPKEAGHGH